MPKKTITPSDIILALNKTKKKRLTYNRKTIRRFFFIDENQGEKLRNSAKNYIAEFADIAYHKNNIVFSKHAHTPL